MKRIKQIAVELNIGVGSIFDYCSFLGVHVSTLNMKIEREIELKIIELHKGKVKVPKTDAGVLLKSRIEIEPPPEFFQTNPFAQDQLNSVQINNRFHNRIAENLSFGDKFIRSIFTDFEAFSICLGLDIPLAKRIARNYFQTGLAHDQDRFDAHQMAVAALEKYGSHILSYVLTLPPLPFKALNAIQIFDEIDNRANMQELPILRLAFENEHGVVQRLHISYYTEKIDAKITKNTAILMVKNQTTGLPIMKISRNGLVLPEPNAKNIVPILELFVRFSNDVKGALLNYGLETGECAICGRKLTDSKSIQIGMGPVCSNGFAY